MYVYIYIYRFINIDISSYAVWCHVFLSTCSQRVRCSLNPKTLKFALCETGSEVRSSERARKPGSSRDPGWKLESHWIPKLIIGGFFMGQPGKNHRNRKNGGLMVEFIGIDGILWDLPSGVIKHGWTILYQWRFLAGKIIHQWWIFQPCLITGGYPKICEQLPGILA